MSRGEPPRRTRLRPARDDEAAALSALAFRAKASNGYPPEFMEACRSELTFGSVGQLVVAERDDTLVGVAGLEFEAGRAEVSDLWVEPSAQGTGVGTALWEALLVRCRAEAVDVIGVAADPAAVGFYRRCGFETTGETPSLSIPGRRLPWMERRP